MSVQRVKINNKAKILRIRVCIQYMYVFIIIQNTTRRTRKKILETFPYTFFVLQVYNLICLVILSGLYNVVFSLKLNPCKLKTTDSSNNNRSRRDNLKKFILKKCMFVDTILHLIHFSNELIWIEFSSREKMNSYWLRKPRQMQTKGMFLVCAHKSKEFEDLEGFHLNIRLRCFWFRIKISHSFCYLFDNFTKLDESVEECWK